MVFAEEPVDVLEGAVGGFGIEEVDDGYEGSVKDDPDDVEFPAQGLDADGGDFDDCGERGLVRFPWPNDGTERSGLPMKLKAQLVAVPIAAPLVRMLRELISTGYSQGTPCQPMPKKT